MNFLVWIDLVLLSVSGDQSIRPHGVDDDELSCLQQELSIHSLGPSATLALEQDDSAVRSSRPRASGGGGMHYPGYYNGTEYSLPYPFWVKTRTYTTSRMETITPPEIRVRKRVLAKYLAMPLAFTAVLVFSITSVLEKFENFPLPDTAVMIILGMGLGYWAKNTVHLEVFDSTSQLGEMVYSTLMLLLLPIIIFTSGWSIRRHDFFSQFPYILLFAIFGVVLSAAAVGGLINLTSKLGLHEVKHVRTALAYAALISATDPVSTLSTYQKLKVDPLLNIIVYGEATLNDAVAIVLFNVFNNDKFMHRFVQMDTVDDVLDNGEQTENIVIGIILNFGIAFGIGVLGACINALLAHAAEMKSNKKSQILMLFASCYLTYAAAESFAVSGIIANLFCGIFSGIYLRPHLSEEGTLMATFFLQQVATLADAAVFVLVGLCVVQLEPSHFNFAALAVVFCLVGRAFAVIPLAVITNFMKRMSGQAAGVPESGWNLLSNGHIFMIWHAGLRGGIALALSLELGQWVDQSEGEGTLRKLQTATFILVSAVLIVFGGTTPCCLKACGISMGQDLPADHLSATEGVSPLRNSLTYVDEYFLAPVLIGRNARSAIDTEADVEQVLSTQIGSKRSASAPDIADQADVSSSDNDQPLIRHPSSFPTFPMPTETLTDFTPRPPLVTLEQPEETRPSRKTL